MLKLTEFVTANDLASMMNVPVNNVIATCMSMGVMVSINQRLDAETINIVAEEFGFRTEYISAEVLANASRFSLRHFAPVFWPLFPLAVSRGRKRNRKKTDAKPNPAHPEPQAHSHLPTQATARNANASRA